MTIVLGEEFLLALTAVIHRAEALLRERTQFPLCRKAQAEEKSASWMNE